MQNEISSKPRRGRKVSRTTVIKYFNGLEKLWNTYKYHSFTYMQAIAKLEPFKLNKSFIYAAVESGVLEKNDGSYKFTKQPTAKDGEDTHAMALLLNQEYRKKVKAGASTKSNKGNLSDTVLGEITKERKLVPITEQQAIDYLKSKGYKIQRPKIEYEEI